MKKQFLLFALALCAGVMVYGQGGALHNSIPRPISCLDDAGHPIAGKPYVYEATGTPAGGNFLFWATKDPNFISTAAGVTTNNLGTRLTTPTDLITTSGNYGVAGVATQVSITWSDATLNGTVPGTTPTFVAAHYTAPVAGCADNFNAWEIQPIKAFIVDVKNVEDALHTVLGYGVVEDQCADIVRSAAYSGGTVNYDFGTNTLYFEVVAANFSGSMHNSPIVNDYKFTCSSFNLLTFNRLTSALHALQPPLSGIMRTEGYLGYEKANQSMPNTWPDNSC